MHVCFPLRSGLLLLATVVVFASLAQCITVRPTRPEGFAPDGFYITQERPLHTRWQTLLRSNSISTQGDGPILGFNHEEISALGALREWCEQGMLDCSDADTVRAQWGVAMEEGVLDLAARNPVNVDPPLEETLVSSLSLLFTGATVGQVYFGGRNVCDALNGSDRAIECVLHKDSSQGPVMWAVMLELGLFLPSFALDHVLQRVDHANTEGIVLSLSGMAGRGTLDGRTNSVIRTKVEGMGYTSDYLAEESLRRSTHNVLLKNSLMVFRRARNPTHDALDPLRKEVLGRAFGIDDDRLVSLSAELARLSPASEGILSEPLTWKDRTDSWLQEVYVRLHRMLHMHKLLPMRLPFWNTTIQRNMMNMYFDTLRESMSEVPADSICMDWGGNVMALFQPVCQNRYIFHFKTDDICEGGSFIDHERKLVCGDIHQLPVSVPDATFDLLLCVNVFEHISDPFVAAPHLFSALKPGGLLVWSAPFLEKFHLSPTDFYRYTMDGAIHILEKQGFCIVDVVRLGNSMLTNAFTQNMLPGDFTYNELLEGYHTDNHYMGTIVVAQRPPCTHPNASRASKG